MTAHTRTSSILAAALLCAGLAAARPAHALEPRLAPVRSWAFAIGDGQLDGDAAARLGRYDLVVVDGEEVTPGLVGSLHASGTVVLGYISVGTIEYGRWWYGSVAPYRMAYWGDWGEWYADVSKSGYRAVLTGRVVPQMLDKGLDGLFLDNVDMVEVYPTRATGMRVLVRGIHSVVHGRGGLVFSQNGASYAAGLASAGYLDGWNREDVSWTYDFARKRYRRLSGATTRQAQRELVAMRAAGLLTLSTDYTDGGRIPRKQCLANAGRVRALSCISDIGLTRLGR